MTSEPTAEENTHPTAPETEPAREPETKQDTKYTKYSLVLIGFSILYLLLEFVFNVVLLEAASNFEISIEQLHNIEYLGRFAAGFGFSLTIAGLFMKTGFRLRSTMQKVMTGLLIMVIDVHPEL